MNEHYDSWDQWIEESRCMICGSNMKYSDGVVCSATCADVLDLRQGNDCYA
jgi:predicted nucleic acid-binding Zn ribbon protein